MHTETMAVISTAHIHPNDREMLSELIQSNRANGFVREEGWVVHTHSPIEPVTSINFPLGFVRSKDVDWLMFDRDADILPELPYWDE